MYECNVSCANDRRGSVAANNNVSCANDNKDKERLKLDLRAVQKAYYNVREICYECANDCEHCRVGDVREDLVELEKYINAILGE